MFCVVAPFSESTLICMTSTYICYITSIRTYISNSKFNFKSNPAFNRWRTLVLAGKGIPIIMGGCTVVEWQSVVFSPIYCTYYEDFGAKGGYHRQWYIIASHCGARLRIHARNTCFCNKSPHISVNKSNAQSIGFSVTCQWIHEIGIRNMDRDCCLEITLLLLQRRHISSTTVSQITG